MNMNIVFPVFTIQRTWFYFDRNKYSFIVLFKQIYWRMDVANNVL